MKTLLCLIALTAFAFTATADENIAGKWTGSFNITGPDGTVKDGGAVVVLQQNGTELTGTAGPDEEQQFPITKGKIDGDKVTLEIHRGEDQVIKMALVLAEDRLKGEATMSSSEQTGTAKVDLGRSK